MVYDVRNGFSDVTRRNMPAPVGRISPVNKSMPFSPVLQALNVREEPRRPRERLPEVHLNHLQPAGVEDRLRVVHAGDDIADEAEAVGVRVGVEEGFEAGEVFGLLKWMSEARRGVGGEVQEWTNVFKSG